MDLTVEDMKKRWQEYTELYKRDLNDPDNQNGVLTHLEPHILGCKVKWALCNPMDILLFKLDHILCVFCHHKHLYFTLRQVLLSLSSTGPDHSQR